MDLRLTREDLEKIHTVKAILEKEYKYHYTNQQLAQKVSTNEFKLKHGFKRIFATSIYACLIRIRIEKAKELLTDTEYPIKRISSAVGFRVIRNFNKNFKKLTGISPMAWRRKHQGGYNGYNHTDLN